MNRNEIFRDEDDYEVLLAASKMNSLEEIRNHLKPFYEGLVAAYEQYYLVHDEDFRSGEETYGYKDLESIQGSLLYISDRWGGAFRVRWLIDLINPDYILYQGEFSATND